MFVDSDLFPRPSIYPLLRFPVLLLSFSPLLFPIPWWTPWTSQLLFTVSYRCWINRPSVQCFVTVVLWDGRRCPRRRLRTEVKPVLVLSLGLVVTYNVKTRFWRSKYQVIFLNSSLLFFKTVKNITLHS